MIARLEQEDRNPIDNFKMKIKNKIKNLGRICLTIPFLLLACSKPIYKGQIKGKRIKYESVDGPFTTDYRMTIVSKGDTIIITDSDRNGKITTGSYDEVKIKTEGKTYTYKGQTYIGKNVLNRADELYQLMIREIDSRLAKKLEY